VATLLPLLHAAMASVQWRAPAAELLPVDLDARFDLYTHLRELLGDRDGYFLEFDRADAMTGSLADDLADIYCELRHGLCAFDANPERVLATWCLGYDRHWCQHLVDAERHLTSLGASDRLDSF
jgi:hypothetical protein